MTLPEISFDEIQEQLTPAGRLEVERAHLAATVKKLIVVIEELEAGSKADA